MSSPRVYEPVPIRRERIDIEESKEPTRPSVQELKQMLNRIGLTCEQTSTEQLGQFIADVQAKLPSSQRHSNQGWFIGQRRDRLRREIGTEADEFRRRIARLHFDPEGGKSVRKAAADPGAAEFFHAILRDNPGGVDFVNQLSPVEHWRDAAAAEFAGGFVEHNPFTTLMLTKLSLLDITPAAVGTWVPKDSPAINEWATSLAELVSARTFDCLAGKSLKNNRNNCRKGEQPTRRWGETYRRPESYEGNMSSADAIKDKYITLAYNASAATAEGLDQTDMTAFLSNLVLPLMPTSLKDYDSRDPKTQEDLERYIFLAGDPQYDSLGNVVGATGAGVIGIKWRIRISEYRRKDKNGGTTHPTNMDIWIRSLLYPSVYKDRVNPTTISEQLDDDLALCPVEE
ncbi:hypothetical protein D5S18_27210 [Nocardia panacis]|uniref:Uncharacterized protein n=1 Tax=Nocardia panacis TaxID=2340916 RepID=A0A3A4KDD0_9NOCA|nr:lectin [Nocardia panacis]RJO70875.1 hypothetical protein D5S18_27210 [Nocardia panacis]